MPRKPKSHRSQQYDRRQYDKAYDAQRGTTAQRGYGGRWQMYRLHFLRQHPLCVECLKHTRTTAATDVDHTVPHKGDDALFWDTDNHQALCESCHSIKTNRERSGPASAI